MTEYRRNIAVGLTAAVSLCGIAYMIMLFGNTPILARRGYLITARFPQADTLDSGADVRLNGIRIGTVADVRLEDDPRKGVIVELRIDRTVRIPANVTVSITRMGIGAGSHIKLTSSPAKAEPTWLPTDGSATLEGAAGGGTGFLGPEMMARVDKILESVESFRRLTDNLNRIAGDEENQANIKQTLANLREASGEAVGTVGEFKQLAADARESLKGVDETTGTINRTVGAAEKHMDTLAARLIDDADRLGELFTKLNKVATTLDENRGSAGKFLNDPAMYNNMLESIEMLTKTLAEMQATIKKWREAGLKVHL